MLTDEQIFAYRDAMAMVRKHSAVPAIKSEVGTALQIIDQLLRERAYLRATVVRQEEALSAAAARMSIDFTATGKNLFDDEEYPNER